MTWKNLAYWKRGAIIGFFIGLANLVLVLARIPIFTNRGGMLGDTSIFLFMSIAGVFSFTITGLVIGFIIGLIAKK